MKNTIISIFCLVALLLVPASLPAGNQPFGDDAVKAASSADSGSSQALAVKPLELTAPKSSIKALPPKYTLDQVFDALNNREPEIMARARHIPDNDEAWYLRWKMISDAKETIDCTYYILDKDIFGQAFLGRLIKKAREGVKIRLMVDGRIFRSGYMKGMPDRIQELAAFPGVQIKTYNSVLKSLKHIFTDFSGLFASNHDKILIPDGKVSLIGGRNIGPDYFVGKGEYPIVYRDSDILMDGEEIAGKLKTAFEEEWNGLRNTTIKPDRFNWKKQLDRLEIAAQVMDRYMHGKGLVKPESTKLTTAQKKLLEEFNAEISKFKNISNYANFEMWGSDSPVPVKILDKHSSLGKMDGITPALIALVDASREEIIIQNPYVVLTAEAWAALKRASARGVKIIFHSNSAASTDSLFPQAFLMNDWKQMLVDMPTCRIYVAPSQNERLHTKTFVFDSKITVIGSYNMDPLSQNANSEIVAAVNDEAFALLTRDRITKVDMEKVYEYKIRITKDGKVERAFGPEDHLTEKLIKKLNFYRRLKWIRPVI